MNSHENVLRVLTWFLVCCECVFIITRLILKRLSWKKFGYDDILAIAALLFSVASSIAVVSAAAKGLGADQLVTSQDDINLLQKRIYVSEIFHILCLCSVKLSILVLLRILFISRLHQTLVGVITAVTVLWGLSATLVVAFQCHLPRPWDLDSNDCINMATFWNCFSAIGIIVDLLIVLLPAVFMRDLKIPLAKKLKITLSFLPWLSAIAAAGTSIGYTRQFWIRNRGSYFVIGNSLWSWFICCQVLRAVSLMAASMPYLKQFVESFPSGLLQTDEIRRHGLTATDIRHGYAAYCPNDGTQIVYSVQDTRNED